MMYCGREDLQEREKKKGVCDFVLNAFARRKCDVKVPVENCAPLKKSFWGTRINTTYKVNLIMCTIEWK